MRWSPVLYGIGVVSSPRLQYGFTVHTYSAKAQNSTEALTEVPIVGTIILSVLYTMNLTLVGNGSHSEHELSLMLFVECHIEHMYHVKSFVSI